MNVKTLIDILNESGLNLESEVRIYVRRGSVLESVELDPTLLNPIHQNGAEVSIVLTKEQ